MMLSLQSAVLAGVGFRHGFLLRPAPDLRPADLSQWVVEPRVRSAMEKIEHDAGEGFLAALGITPPQLHFVRQVHGTEVLYPLPTAVGACVGEADALVVGAGGGAAGIVSADCVPLLMGDPSSGAVAAVHAGWRGLVRGVAPAAIAGLQRRYGVAPGSLRVALFPHIRSCCFEIGEEVAAPLARVSVRAVCRRPGQARPFGMMSEALLAQLHGAGVRPEHIEDVPGCTCCDAERFVSFRRDGVGAGRHWAVIASHR